MNKKRRRRKTIGAIGKVIGTGGLLGATGIAINNNTKLRRIGRSGLSQAQRNRMLDRIENQGAKRYLTALGIGLAGTGVSTAANMMPRKRKRRKSRRR